jgi:uncharacterized protein YjbI with pentapeptide repeats
MPKETLAEIEIRRLKELEENTKVIKIDLKDIEDREILDEYIREHKNPNGKEIAKGSFNDFLAQHEKYKGKVVVAEISGGSLGSESNPKVVIDGADFTGCILNDVEISEADNVSFRDCVFEKVRIMAGEFSNIDFRGSKLYECEFFSSDNIHSLNDIQLDFANPNAVQDKGVFAIEDSNSAAISIGNLERKLAKQQLAEIKEYLTAENAKRYHLVNAIVGGIDPNKWGKTLHKSDLSKEQQQHITSIEEKYKKQLKEESAKIHQEVSVRFHSPKLDPTYTPNQSPERASAIKLSLKATREDLEEYLAGNKEISFNEFIAEKNSEAIAEAKEKNPGKTILLIADLSGQDISEMNLSKLKLEGINLSYCKINGCNLNGSTLTGTCLEGSEIKGSSFNGANLMDCNMIGVKADAKTSFKKTNMIRARVNASELRGVQFDEAVGYMASFRDSDMEGAHLVRADMRQSDFSRVNLRSVDARYAQMERANLTDAIAKDANLMHANLTKVIAARFNAQSANLEKAVAKGADFSDADLKEMQAVGADFEKAIFERADAEFANFERATLNDARAEKAKFKKAILKKVKGNRIDLKGAALDEANLQDASLEKAIMEDISARKADFKGAVLKEANLKRAEMIAADLRKADLSKAQAQGAVLMAADLEGADVTKMEIDDATILIDANLRGLLGDDKTVKALQLQQKEQHALKEQWFGRSKYGHCSRNNDGSNDRFKCQILGAMILNSVIAGGAGTLAGGPLAGIPAGALAALIGDTALAKAKDHYFEDKGFIDNMLGDRLAEIGAVALSMGVGAADKAIDGAAAGVICSMAGVLNGAAITAAGLLTTIGGAKLLKDGVNKQSGWRKWTGKALIAAGSVTSFLGLTQFGAHLNTIAYTTVVGGVVGAIWEGQASMRKLYNFDGKGDGARPEEIYRESIIKAKTILTKIMPTMRKLLIGTVLAIVACAAAIAVVKALPLIGAVGLVQAAVMTNTAITAASAGFAVGYLYDNKITGLAHRFKENLSKKISRRKNIQAQEPQSEAPKAKVDSRMQEPQVEAETDNTEHKSHKKTRFTDRHKKKVQEKREPKKRKNSFAQDITERKEARQDPSKHME